MTAPLVAFLGASSAPLMAHAQTDSSAHAPESVAPGRAAFDRARASWDKGDYDVAEPLYAEAIEKGGLPPADVLQAYIHLGSARAVLGKKAGALAAFKTAALLDFHFAVPPEAGKRATTSADQARRLEARVSPLAFHADIPTEVAAGDPAKIDVTLDASHAALPGSRIGVYAYDAVRGSASQHTASVRAAKAAHFELPKELSLPSATLHVRVDWLDVHANRLASAEEQIHVQPEANTAAKVPFVALDVDPARARDASGQDGQARKESHDDHTRTGFWHTAWPYILGGAALAAGGVALYFATRTGDDVNVSGVRVVTN
jgi:hypothetical protein